MKIEGGNQWQGKSVNSNEVIDLLADDLMSEVILFSTTQPNTTCYSTTYQGTPERQHDRIQLLDCIHVPLMY